VASLIHNAQLGHWFDAAAKKCHFLVSDLIAVTTLH